MRLLRSRLCSVRPPPSPHCSLSLCVCACVCVWTVVVQSARPLLPSQRTAALLRARDAFLNHQREERVEGGWGAAAPSRPVRRPVRRPLRRGDGACRMLAPVPRCHRRPRWCRIGTRRVRPSDCPRAESRWEQTRWEQTRWHSPYGSDRRGVFAVGGGRCAGVTRQGRRQGRHRGGGGVRGAPTAAGCVRDGPWRRRRA